MEHQRHAHRLEAAAGEFGPVRRCRWRQLAADDVREADAAALEQVALLDDARQPAAAERSVGGLLPVSARKGRPVEVLERGNDPLLQADQVLAYGLGR